MKVNKLVLVLILFTILSCKKEVEVLEEVETIETITIYGNYTGTFFRDGIYSNVELAFNDWEFTGTSETDNFPAICNGSYTLSDSVVSFQNKCSYTANFDWTLILSGNWNYTLNDNVLKLNNFNGGEFVLTN